MILYSKDSKDRLRIWEIKAEGDSYYTRDGIEGGKVKDWIGRKCIAKNIGKSNATTAEQQAISEMENKITCKLQEGYYKTKAEALNDTTFNKMLAHPLEKYIKNAVFPYYMTRKLDGVASNPIDGKMMSRNGKPFTSCPHILKELELFQKKNPNIILCGELYSHEYHDKFDQLISIIRTQKPTKEELIISEEQLQYHVYDLYNKEAPDLSLSIRMNLLEVIFKDFFKNSKCIRLEKSIKINNQKEADEFHMKAIEAGYEGSMIRTSQCLYEPGKRSSHLLKRKDFITEEYEIVDIIEGNGQWSGRAKEIKVKVKENITGTGIRGSFEFCTDLLNNKNKYIGKKATVRHFGETKDGLLRFGVVIAIRNYE